MTSKKAPARRGPGRIPRLKQSKRVARASKRERATPGIIESARLAEPLPVLSGPLDRKRWKERGVPIEPVRSAVAKIRSTRIPEVVLPADHAFWWQAASDLALVLAILQPGRGTKPSARIDVRKRSFLQDALDECGTWRAATQYLAGTIAGMLPRPRGRPDEQEEVDRVLGTRPPQRQVVEEARRILEEGVVSKGKRAVGEALKRLGFVDDPRFLNVVKRLSDKPRRR